MSSEPLFTIIRPESISLPILISVPHSGLFIPKNIKNNVNAEQANELADTDFFVDQVYDFALKSGITLIKANYSRYVVDLNRNPDNIPLYPGRKITSVVPEKTFSGEPIYKDYSLVDIKNRVLKFHAPYYNAIQNELNTLKLRHKNVVLWDAHSIDRVVPEISKDPLKDLMLGTRQGTSAEPKIITFIQNIFEQSNYSFILDGMFKGGNITKTFSNPQNGIHSIQLEMSKDIYMNTNELKIEKARADILSSTLEQTITSLAKFLETL